jgi:RND family efflux transporter MFP subunit
MVDPGNLVKADDTMLTTIITSDPMYAYFDVDERTLLRLRRMVREGRIQSAREAALPVELGLTDEEGFSMNGTIDFVDNRLVTNTGTLRVRGLFANPKNILSPGLFVRVRMPVGRPRPAIMVPEQSLGTDQGQKFVYVVDDKNVVQYRKVKVGPQQESLRAIEQGVAMGDRVIVSGLQRVRPGLTVDPKMAEKPSPGTADNGHAAAKS